MRVGVFLPNWIGDVAMATPALRSLRQLADQGGGRLVGVMRPYVAPVLEGTPWLDLALLHDPKSEDASHHTNSILRSLRDAQLDAIVLLTNSLRTGWLAWRSGVSERIGYARELRGPLLTTCLFEPRKRRRRLTLPAIDSYLNLAYAAGGSWQPPTLQLATTEADEATTDDVWRRLGLPSGENVAVFNTGGAFGAAKAWPPEYFSELARRMVDGREMHVLINCGPGEREVARQIERDADRKQVTSLAEVERLPIGLSKAIIKRSRLLVTTDSGPRFFGLAFGRPVVTLFGPTDPNATRTHSPLETTLSLNLDCQPCWKGSCPLSHHRCMRDLPVSRVLQSVDQTLGQEDASIRAA